MAIPDYQTIMLPLLQLAGDEQEHFIRDAIEHISSIFKLSLEDKKEKLPSGQQFVIDNRVGWARTYLKKAGLLEAPRRGCFKITKEGTKVLKDKPEKIDIHFLNKFPGFKEFRKSERKGRVKAKIKTDEELKDTPVEALENAYVSIRGDLALEIINQIKQCSPKFFERLVVELLLKMGYGGAIKDAGKAIGQTADGGIDGIIKEDRLGLDVIYLQAKRWENTVGIGQVRDFVGSLAGRKADKGVFITTSNFANKVHGYIKTLQYKVILIDGETLAQFMIDYDVGVSKVTGYDVKKIDYDYFVEE